MYDTLYLEVGEPESVLLRTHTSPTQIRVMEASEPPIYSVMPGRCYRQDTADASHLPNFHQIEGLVVDRGITFGDLAGTLDAFTGAYFGPGITTRLRPSYFPFTEPSAEFDITCVFCGGEGAGRAVGPAGWSSGAAAWSTPTSSRTWATTPRSGPASPSGSASTA
jgi:phenylalanyl-tRNA synthetase alpha chain